MLHLLKNQLKAFLGIPTGSLNGKTIDETNAPTNSPKDKKYGAIPVP